MDKPASGDAKPKPKGWTNPALQAMGIPRIRIPSRNWMIFWAVTGSIAGIWIYDRRERRRVREEWKNKVAFMATQRMNPLEMPRKVTVYIAPPPGDYLDLTMSHFRQYIKPILVAAAIDYEVMSETRQGDIRSQVAEQIRNKRRASLGVPTTEDEKDEFDNVIRSRLQVDKQGGVICVGRGAYKEYMNGIHEGWLGPLEPPVEDAEPATTESHPASVEDTQVATTSEGDSSSAEATVQNLDTAVNKDEEFPDREKDLKDVHGELKTDDKEKNEEEDDKKKKKPVPKAYIRTSDYERTEIPMEFESLAQFEPIAPISHPHLLGFLNTPTRIYRFFTRRHLADQMGAATAAVVFGATRPFELSMDADALIQEENDWPSKWKRRGLESGSEWMWDFHVDDRIGSKLSVYELQDQLQNESNTSEVDL
jgi:import inner membrane translocase subunit TIM54